MASPTQGARPRQSARLILAACIGLVLTASACHQTIEVRTVSAPNAQFSGRRSFRILEPQYQGAGILAEDDPMLVNSITYQALRDEIRHEFESRGYVYSAERPDLEVAYYALVRPVTDIRTYGYHYDWRGFPHEYVDVVQYQQGTVIVDVIDPTAHLLMWRGQGTAAVDTDPNRYTDALKRAVEKIAEKFPAAS